MRESAVDDLVDARADVNERAREWLENRRTRLAPLAQKFSDMKKFVIKHLDVDHAGQQGGQGPLRGHRVRA